MKTETKTETPIMTCSNYFGYLSQLSGEKETPDECLMCTKLLECKLSKSDSTPPRIEPKTQASKEAKLSVEEPGADIVKNELEETIGFETKAEPLPVESSGNQFVVENMGMLYTSWSGTVHISRETLSSWGEKINEICVVTNAGKKTRCKVMPSDDPRKGIILIPDKMQLDLEIRKGELVRVEPVIVSEKEDKLKDIAQVFSKFKKISPRIVKQLKRLKPPEKDSA